MRSLRTLIVLAGLALAACAVPAPNGDVAPAAPAGADAGPRIKLTGWQTGVRADHPLVGRALLTASGRMVDWPEVSRLIRSADFLLLGEKHDNPDHHLLQARLLADLVDGGRRPGVAWEMIPVDKASALARYLSRPEATPEAMGAAVDWEESGWPDWAIYRPIAKVAMQAGLPQVPGDLTRDDRRSIARAGLGGLSAASAELVAARALWTPELDASLRNELIGSHCGMIPTEIIPRMVNVQRARDVSLALAMVEVATDDGAVLIAGAGHARKDRGVPLYLRVVQPAAKVVSVGIFEVQENMTTPLAYLANYGTGAFDLVLFTPALDTKDPCEALRKHGTARKG
ncbi:MAG: ChaN family lipoprotein [Pseudomonadota bacterium]|nr:ChaN family lipoprotein [Pseudomonadota bacterium]